MKAALPEEETVVRTRVKPPARVPQTSEGIARASALIGGLTIVSRVVGFLRTVVLGRVLGAGVLADTYIAANTVPNVVYEAVAGGALTGVVVPVLAGPVATRDRQSVSRTVSALLTWTVLLLTPLAVLGAVFSRQVIGLLIEGTAPDRAARVHLGSRMLVVFMPQVVLYGIGVVCTGTLHAHRRFFAPAVAPLTSSLVVISSYLLFASLRTGVTATKVSRTGALVLSVGTTLGVLALTLTVAIPTMRLRLGLRPMLRFPAGVAAAVRRLAVAGTAGLVAQQASVLVAMRLASGQEGAQTVFFLATTVFLLPWAVLAVPVATSAFPALTEAMSRRVLSPGGPAGPDGPRYDRIFAGALRAVLLGSLVAAGLMVAVAEPLARLLLKVHPGTSPTGVAALRDAVVAFAPGLPGFAVLALATRALYARRVIRRTGVAVVTGWVMVIVADMVLVAAVPPAPTATLLGVGNSIGMTVAGVLLLAVLASVGAGKGLAGAGRTFAIGGLAGVAAAVAGGVVGTQTGTRNAVLSLAACGLAGLVAAGTVVWLTDREDSRRLIRGACS